jgi:hypothetical protein
MRMYACLGLENGGNSLDFMTHDHAVNPCMVWTMSEAAHDAQHVDWRELRSEDKLSIPTSTSTQKVFAWINLSTLFSVMTRKLTF